jgi:tetratricopeptide (TPR) repeat protein
MMNLCPYRRDTAVNDSPERHADDRDRRSSGAGRSGNTGRSSSSQGRGAPRRDGASGKPPRAGGDRRQDSGERRSYGDRSQSGGSSYGSGERRSYGDRPQSGGSSYGSGERRSYGDRPQSGGGERRSYGDRPQSGGGERRSYGDRPQSGGSSYGSGERRSYGDRSQSGGGERRSYGDRPQSGGGERRSYGDRPQSGDSSYGGGERRSYGDRPQSGGGERRTHGDRSQSGGGSYGSGERRSYGDRSQSGGGERRSYGDRPQSGGGERRSYGDRTQSGARERKSFGERPQRSSDQGERQSRPPQDQRHAGPEIDEAVQFSDLDRDVRGRLRTLSKENATVVGRHLVMAGKLIDSDPELAYEHAQAAVRRAGRVDVVREAAGLTAYQTGRYAEALRELRTVRRLNGSSEHLPIMADCERGLGRPERAIALAASEEASTLDATGRTELALVVSGARVDLGEFEAALAVLDQIPPAQAQGDLALRVLQAKAGVLEAAGRVEEAAALLADVDPRALAAALGTPLDEDVVVYDLTEDAVAIDEASEHKDADDDSGTDHSAQATTVAEPSDETDASASGVETDGEAK